MHKSKLGGFIIDCRTDDLSAATAFWSAALGMPVLDPRGGQSQVGQPPDDPPPAGQPPNEASYRALHDMQHGLDIEVQRVEHESRVHLDIETDDIDAEVRRLEQLGARQVAQISNWWVMEAPTGQRFCVVPAKSPCFDQQASEWSAA